MSADTVYDYISIGGGSGGMASARRAATFGAKVLVVERGRKYGGAGLGGTCVHYGCVPKKIMFNTAAHVEHLNRAADYSITTNGGKKYAFGDFDWANMKTKRDAYILRLNGIYERNLGNAQVDLIEGVAKFVAKNQVEVDGVVYTGKHILIAVGGKPSLPDTPGIEHVIDSDGFFKLEAQPKKVAVVGAGYIAIEIAGVFNTLKSDTSLFCRFDHVLRTFDPIVRDLINEEGAKAGINFVTNSRIERIEKQADGTLTITAKVNGEEQVFPGFDTVLYAIGREPRTKGLGLEDVGVKLNDAGFIVVDAQENTTVPGIYAIGDATITGWELTPVAIAAGRRLADRLFGGEPDALLHYHQIPTVVFSHPPLGTIGYTEPQAIEKFGAANVKSYTSKFVNLLYAMADPDHKGKTAMKLVTVGEDEVVVGVHVAGEGADEMIQGFGVAMKMNATKADFDNIVAIHPTASEELVTMAPWGQIKDKITVLSVKPEPTPQ
ncbi:Glutathione-disulfide reductase [Globisporangium polare]